MKTHSVRAGVLDVCYEEDGTPDGTPAILSHGFPYDARAFDDVVRAIAVRCRVIVPYLRGYGATRFVDPATPRSGEQAALGHDLLALMDALGIERAILGGYDWGGRAACVVAALEPRRVRGLVTCGGYDVQHIASAHEPAPPDTERRKWYQYYLHGDVGRVALERRRDEFCRYLWQAWSPTWAFDDATFARTAVSFDNPDFVEVVLHSYRHRYGLVAGDPAYAEWERRLSARPQITVPTIDLSGADDGVDVPAAALSAEARAHFGTSYDRRLLDGVGHDVPQEAPGAFAAAIVELAG